MSVYTSVNIEELKIWLQDYALDNLTDYQGIKSGITNTNYFLMTAHDRFVLTLFEKNTIEDLPYFVDLMAHLAKNSFLCLLKWSIMLSSNAKVKRTLPNS